ncbi:MAG: NnrS family protein [Arcobacter sp.]|nr:NnrS family protein [Arcobacter sp.]
MTFTAIPNQQKLHPKKEIWRKRFLSQPHQLFFTSSIVFAFTAMILTMISLIGKIPLDFSIVHSFGLIYGVFTNAFLGFLITVIPKYTTSTPIASKTYFPIWIAYQIAILIGLFESILMGKILIAGILFYICKVLYDNIKEGYNSSKQESYILTGLLGLSAILLCFEAVSGLDLSVLIFYAYLINLVFVVAQKMIPSFYSVFTQEPKWEKPNYFIYIALILFFLIGVSTQFELNLLNKTITLISLAFFSYFLFNLNIYKRTPPIISILIVGFIWLEIGIIALFIESFFEIKALRLSLHIFALGFVLNLLIGFGSRVIMGHAAPPQKITADRFIVALFILTQAIIVARLFSSLLFLNNLPLFTGLLHLSIFLWTMLFLGWTIRFWKTILRVK